MGKHCKELTCNAIKQPGNTLWTLVTVTRKRILSGNPYSFVCNSNSACAIHYIVRDVICTATDMFTCKCRAGGANEARTRASK